MGGEVNSREGNQHRTPKQTARLLITAMAREFGVNHGVADVGMTKPILYVLKLTARVEKVSSNAVLEYMEVTLVLRQPSEFAVLLHQHVKHTPSDWSPMARREEHVCIDH